MADTVKGLYRRGRIFWLSHQRNHRRVFVTLETDDEAVAIQRARQFLTHPELNPTAGLRGDVAAFLHDKFSTGAYSDASVRKKGGTLRRFSIWSGCSSAEAITPSVIQEWLASLTAAGVQQETIRAYLMTLRSFGAWAMDNHLRRDNPAASIKLRHVISRARLLFCTRDQRDLILARAPNDSLRYILYCGFHAGLRRNEIIQSRPDWFNLDIGTLTVPAKTDTFRSKNSRSRTVPLTNSFREFLRAYGLRSPFMLRPDVQQGRNLYRYDYAYPFAEYMRSLNLSWVTSHVMRHTFASLLAIAGRSIYKIALWLGDTVETAQTHYAKLLPIDHDIELD